MINNRFQQSQTGFEALQTLLRSVTGVEGVELADKCKSTGFSRTVTFEVFAYGYKITWFVNQMTLECESGMQVVFDNVHSMNTWPVRGVKSSLQFEMGDRTVAFLPTEREV